MQDPDAIRYIGKANNAYKRLNTHISPSSLSRNTHKSNWIKKVLFKGETLLLSIIDIIPYNEWKYWETFWISQFKAWNFKLTNLTTGGDNNDGKHRAESIIKMKASSHNSKKVVQYNLKGEVVDRFNSMQDAATKNKCNRSHISACCKRNHNHKTVKGYVYRFLEDTFDYLSTPRKGKKVYQYDRHGNLINKFISIHEAGRQNNIESNSISACLNKRKSHKTAGGFIWLYENEKFYNPKKYERKKASFHKNKQVVKIDKNNKVICKYCSIKDAAMQNKISTSTIFRQCNNLSNTSKNYKWQYA